MIYFALVIFSAICLFAAYVLIRMPKMLIVRRSELIDATPSEVFPYLESPRLIQQWSPFASEDPSVKAIFTGPELGVGAAWAWEGVKAGKGKATITEVEAGRRVVMRLDFEKPFKGSNFGEFSLAPVTPDRSEVTWQVNELTWIPRALSTLLNLDKAIGGQFEKGLSILKSLLEKPPGDTQ